MCRNLHLLEVFKEFCRCIYPVKLKYYPWYRRFLVYPIGSFCFFAAHPSLYIYFQTTLDQLTLPLDYSALSRISQQWIHTLHTPLCVWLLWPRQRYWGPLMCISHLFLWRLISSLLSGHHLSPKSVYVLLEILIVPTWTIAKKDAMNFIILAFD